MPYYEKRFERDGVPVSIQCITVTRCKEHTNRDMHYHDYTELLFGIEGVANVFVGDSTHKLCPGDMIIIHGHELHDVDGNGERSSYIVIKFLPSILLSPDQSYPEYSYSLCLMQNTETRQTLFRSTELLTTPVPALFHHAMAEWNSKKFAYELSLRADVTSIFLHILRKWHEKNMGTEPLSIWQGELIQRAISYINQNYVDLTEESCASELGISTSYLSRVFKKCMKQSFTSYVQGVRLAQAERMLISGDMTITEIGECTGFSTSAYFIATFKARHGLTPGQYRKKFSRTAEK